MTFSSVVILQKSGWRKSSNTVVTNQSNKWDTYNILEYGKQCLVQYGNNATHLSVGRRAWQQGIKREIELGNQGMNTDRKRPSWIPITIIDQLQVQGYYKVEGVHNAWDSQIISQSTGQSHGPYDHQKPTSYQRFLCHRPSRHRRSMITIMQKR